MNQETKKWIDMAEMDYGDELTPYGVVVSYPSELFLEEHHIRDALKMADAIIRWRKIMIKSIHAKE